MRGLWRWKTLKANIIPLIRDHLRTMTDARTGRLLWWDLVLFYGVPLVLVMPSIKYHWTISGIDNILASLALMAGLLFNLLILLFDTAVRIRDDKSEFAGHRRRLIGEMQANVSYSLAIAILTSTILGATSLAGISKAGLPLSAVSIFLLSHFVLLLALILRRVRAIFLHELPGMNG